MPSENVTGNETAIPIQLSGFSDLDDSEKAAINKIISGYVKRYKEITLNMQRLDLHLKKIHAQEKSEKYQIDAKLRDSGKVFGASLVGRHLLTAVDEVLKKIEHEISK